MGRALELRLSLQVTLAAYFGLGSLVEKNRPVADLRQLETVGGLFHKGMAIDTRHAAPRVRARSPIGLHAALVAAKAHLILNLRRLTRVFTEGDQTADAFSAAGGNVVAAGTVTAFASPLLRFVARVEQKNFPHLGLRKFFKLLGVAGFTNFVADVSRRNRLGRFFFRG